MNPKKIHETKLALRAMYEILDDAENCIAAGVDDKYAQEYAEKKVKEFSKRLRIFLEEIGIDVRVKEPAY